MGWNRARELPELCLTTSGSEFAMAYGNLMCGDHLENLMCGDQLDTD